MKTFDRPTEVAVSLVKMAIPLFEAAGQKTIAQQLQASIETLNRPANRRKRRNDQ